MNSFSSTCAGTATAPSDPRKHVNYVQGMVLGADDLNQEFVYHRHQNHWLARDAIGYGTLNGLKVAIQTSSNGPAVAVTPGTALSPRGQLIRVAPDQCAALNSWLALADTKTQLQALGIGPNGPVTAYVVLCFRDCKTDPLPVPGEPCRCDSDATAPSRITDDFRLELRLKAPSQTEENAIRDFVQWLRGIKVTSAASGYSSIEDFLQAIRDAAQILSSPIQSQLSPIQWPPAFLCGSPPGNLLIPSNRLCDYLRAAMRLWVTELRPLWQTKWALQVGGGCGCHGTVQTVGEDGEECLLLAALRIQQTGGQVSDPTQIQVDDSGRPFVVHLRMLQEWLLCGFCGSAVCNERAFATVFALGQHTLRIWVHHPLTVHLTEAAIQLELDDQPVAGFSVAPVSTGSGQQAALEHNVFDLHLSESPLTLLEERQRFALKFDTRLIVENASPSRLLADAIAQSRWCYPDFADDVVTVFGSVELGSQSQAQSQPQASNALPGAETFSSPGSVGSLASYARADHAHPMTADPVPPHVVNTSAHLAHLIKGDVQGTLGAASVEALQGVGFAGGPPASPANDGNVLTFNNGKWQPAAPQTGGGPGQFVEHATNQRYLIVAAGRFQVGQSGSGLDGSPIGPVYNNLTAARAAATPGYLLHFGEPGQPAPLSYKNPAGDFMYIVKGTVVSNKIAGGDFYVMRFEDGGIRVQVLPSNPDQVIESFMVEISLYGKF
jgi:hypothetical protein